MISRRSPIRLYPTIGKSLSGQGFFRLRFLPVLLLPLYYYICICIIYTYIVYILVLFVSGKSRRICLCFLTAVGNAIKLEMNTWFLQLKCFKFRKVLLYKLVKLLIVLYFINTQSLFMLPILKLVIPCKLCY